jgi:hypothetical protein
MCADSLWNNAASVERSAFKTIQPFKEKTRRFCAGFQKTCALEERNGWRLAPETDRTACSTVSDQSPLLITAAILKTCGISAFRDAT